MCEQYIPDEACWSLYEEITRQFPQAEERLYLYNLEYRPLEDLPYGRLLVVRNDLIAFEEAAAGGFGDCMVGQCPWIPRLGSGDFALPKNSADPGNRSLSPSSRNAIRWGVAHAVTIQIKANQYGVPPELVAGLIVAEIDLDNTWYGLRLDDLVRTAYETGNCNIIDAFTNTSPGSSVGQRLNLGDRVGGYSNVHHDTYVLVDNYMVNQYNKPLYGTNKRDYLQYLLTNEGAIEFTARFGRYLADLRTGNKASHASDLSLVDMAQIWGAWRNGINGVTCSGTCGFSGLGEFQTKQSLGAQAELGYAYFEYFQDFFNH